MNRLLTAIVDDDVGAVERLLRADASFSTQLVRKPRPDESGIFHWIYVGDNLFHLEVQNTGRGGSGAPEAIEAQREIIAEFLARGVSPGLKNGGGKSVADCAKSGWIRGMLSRTSA